MLIRKQEDGTNGYLVSYALADGAHFVPPNSALFDHALYKRGGSSFYLPGEQRCEIICKKNHISGTVYTKRRAGNYRLVRAFDCSAVYFTSQSFRSACASAMRCDVRM
eukprot:3247837-Rhodomonas_salina.1